MTIAITCECGKKLRAKDSLLGKRATCPACGRHLLVAPPNPIPGSSTESSDETPIVEATLVQTPDAPVNRWPNGVRVVSGLGPFGEYEAAFIQSGSEFFWINGKQTSSHIVVIICSILMISLFCLPVGIIMLFVVPFDLTIGKRNREAVWNAFLNCDLRALCKRTTYCKRFAMSELSSIAFNEANDKLYVRFGGRRRFKIKCGPDDRVRFREFAQHCRQVSGATDSLFFSFP